MPKINTETCRRKYLENGIKLRLGEICYGVNDGTVVHDKCQVWKIIIFVDKIN